MDRSEGLTRTWVVDRRGRILDGEGFAAPFTSEVFLSRGSPLGDAAHASLDALEATGLPQRCAVRDPSRGRHWILETRLFSTAPWRAQLLFLDATLAVQSEREATFARFIHLLNNATFAISSVLEAFELNGPTGSSVDEYFAHVRVPLVRLSEMSRRMAESIQPISVNLVEVSLGSLVREGLRRVRASAVPEEIRIPTDSPTIQADPQHLAEAMARLLESAEPELSPKFLRVFSEVESGAAKATVEVAWERTKLAKGDLALLWEPLETPGPHLPRVRSVVLAHHGEVLAAPMAPGGLRLTLRFPCMGA